MNLAPQLFLALTATNAASAATVSFAHASAMSASENNDETAGWGKFLPDFAVVCWPAGGYVIIQFGHNSDGIPARQTTDGVGTAT
ncbi:hypothetical protein C8J57DRAFT_1537317 [Mycena rebaudengoi]|nr:hypothetical protein C8J57DRAFT_1537317 [Mycena rebaudengoi]